MKNLAGCVLPDSRADAIARERLASLKQQGYKILSGWDRSAPSVFVERYPGTNSYSIPRYRHSLLDHLYRLKRPDGEMLYVSEPYDIVDGFDVLASLDIGGQWTVTISADYTLHFPGRTVAITFARRKEE